MSIFPLFMIILNFNENIKNYEDSSVKSWFIEENPLFYLYITSEIFYVKKVRKN